MDITQLIAAFVASAIGTGTVFRFFTEKVIESSLQKVLHKEMLLTETDLDFRKRQLEEFYGPIYASLKLNSQIYDIWNTSDNVLQEINQEIIKLFINNNQEIIDILKTKAHLIDGEKFPPEFERFMTSSTIWGMYCRRSDQPWIPDTVKHRLTKELAWPQAFETHIYQKTEELKKELDSLLIKYRAK